MMGFAEQMKSLSQNQAYRQFVNQRDVALEIILDSSLTKIDNVLRGLFKQWIDACRMVIMQSKINQTIDPIVYLQALDRSMMGDIKRSTEDIKRIAIGMRKKAFQLTMVAQAEIIARTLDKKGSYTFNHNDMINRLNAPSMAGGKLDQRIAMNLFNVASDLKKMTHWLMMNKDISDREIVQMLLKKLPRSGTITRTKRLGKTKKIQEAKKKPSVDFAIGFITDDDWNDIVEDLRSDFPVDRSPDAYYGLGLDADGEEIKRYHWELERELTDDFVLQVRSGEIESAKQNGITDFVWVAVVDNRTDDCCLWRDGLTLTEIEERLKKDKKDDQELGLVPPIHFNCRCRVEPATSDLPPMPESNKEEFDEWINS